MKAYTRRRLLASAKLGLAAIPFWLLITLAGGDALMSRLALGPEYEIEDMGAIPLSGKRDAVDLCSVTSRASGPISAPGSP